MTQPSTAGKRYRRMLQKGSEDPLGGVANLFDVAMVFAVALILALINALKAPELLSATDDITIIKNPGKADMEILRKNGVQLERLTMTDEESGGNGTRLGVCFQLPGGDVIYVPDTNTSKENIWKPDF